MDQLSQGDTPQPNYRRSGFFAGAVLLLLAGFFSGCDQKSASSGKPFDPSQTGTKIGTPAAAPVAVTPQVTTEASPSVATTPVASPAPAPVTAREERSPVEAVATAAAPLEAPKAITEVPPVTEAPALPPKSATPPATEVAAKSTPPPAPLQTPVPTPEPVRREGGFLTVTFDKLAGFNFEMTDEVVKPTENAGSTKKEGPGQIPADIQALDNQKVALKGYMLPLKVEGGLVTELLIMRDQSMCCYGTVPKINEWVSVKMTQGIKPHMDQAVILQGKLKVGEVRESGYLVGIYQLEGEKLVLP